MRGSHADDAEGHGDGRCQPSQYSGPVTTSLPITFGRRASTINSTITGAASTPLSAAPTTASAMTSVNRLRQPLQNGHIAVVVEEDLGNDRDSAEQEHV